MASKHVCLLLVFALGLQPSARAQAPLDAEVVKGIKQVEDGDLAEAIYTLDTAARRLAGDPARTRDLGQAYLYLGIAYLGKGQETLAKARFRDAVKQQRELSLNPDQYSPKVIELLETAKKESAAAASPAPAPTPGPTAAPKRGSKLPRVLIGAAAVAGGAIALSATGGAGANDPPDFTRFYGTYPTMTFANSSGGCAPALAALELSGNADGTNFRINKLFPPLSTNTPVLFTGSIQATGHFTGSGGGYSITGQSTGSRIAGSETRQTGGPACTWMFDQTR